MFFRSDANYTIPMANKQGCRNSQTTITADTFFKSSNPIFYIIQVSRGFMPEFSKYFIMKECDIRGRSQTTFTRRGRYK